MHEEDVDLDDELEPCPRCEGTAPEALFADVLVDAPPVLRDALAACMRCFAADGTIHRSHVERVHAWPAPHLFPGTATCSLRA